MKKNTLLFLFLFICLFGFTQTVQIGSGSGTSTGTAGMPISNYVYNYNQQIVTAAEITAGGGSAGNILKIRYKPTNVGTISVWNNWTVYVANTSKTTFASNTDWEPFANLTQVFSGIIPTPTANQWFEITFTAPFAYTGGNLIIAVDENTSNWTSAPTFSSYTSATNTGIYYRSDTVNPDPATPPTATGRVSNVPQLQLVFQPTAPPNCTTTHLPTDLATNVVINPMLSWIDGGGGTESYDVYFGTSTNPPLVGNVAVTNYNPGFLIANTQYFWRIVPKNVIGDTIGCLERSFTTGTEIGYCTPSSTNTSTYINNFSTSLGSTNISNLLSGYTTGGYQNNYSSQTITSFETGTFNFNLEVVGGTLGAAIWIDWNLNGVFDTSERVFVTSAYGNGPYSGAITVPGGTSQGDYRMRVMVDYNSLAPSNPCMTANARTETEDYKVVVSAPPACLPPTSLIVSNIGSTGADLSWTDSTSSPVNGYDIYWNTTNTAPVGATTPTIDNYPSNSYNALGLSSNTTYYWWVRSDCGGDLSSWASGGSFTTLCSAITVPTSLETFEGASSGIPVCWSTSLVSGTTNWDISNGSSGDISAAYAGTNFMEKDYNTSDAVLVSMPIDYSLVSAATRINVFLHRHASAHANDQYRIYINTAPTLAGASQVFSLYSRTTIAPTVASTGWYNYTIDIPGSFNGQSQVFIIFEGITTAGFSSYDLGIDNFIVEYAPSCLQPSSLVVSNIGLTTADFSWTDSPSSPANGYDIYWNTSNTAPDGATTPTVINHPSNSYNALGLTNNTTYYWWVRSDCGSSDYSLWSFGGSFTTHFAVSAPYTEDFVTTTLPANWTSTTGWNVGSTRGATGNPGNNLYKNFWGSATTGNYSLVNVTDITSGMYLTFDYQFTNYDSPYSPPVAGAGSFNIEISTNFGTTYTSIGTINLDGTSGWKSFAYDLAAYVGQTVKVRVSGTRTSGDWDAAFDNFAINVPYCLLTTTWDGASWDNGVPVASIKAVINGNYSGAGFEACTLDVLGTSLVDITSGILNIDGIITVDSSASLELQNGVYVMQNQNVANSGNTIVNQDSAPMIRLDYTAWSSPVANQNLLNFSPNTLTNRFYTYDPSGVDTATSWIAVTDPSATNFNSGVGYLIRVANNWSSSVYSSYLGQYTGILNNGDYSSAVGIGYNLVGNPYPSPIDADTFLTDNAGIGATTMYFWTHTIAANSGSYAQNNYASYTTAGGVAAAAGGAQPDGTIQVGQGFFINATSAGNAQFNNAQRVGSSSGQFFKSSSTVERHRFWLNLTDNSNSYNQMMVAYMTDATNGVDAGIDGKLFTNALSSIASIVNNEPYIIQGRSLSFDVNDEVPLHFSANSNGNYSISLNNFDGLFTSQDIFIWDKEQNVIHDLKASDYNFTAIAGVNTTRFSVVYTTNALSENDFVNDVNLVVYASNNNIIVNAGKNIINQVTIYDIQGRKLISKNSLNVSETTIENTWGTNQVLIVEIFTEKGRTVKKIIL